MCVCVVYVVCDAVGCDTYAPPYLSLSVIHYTCVHICVYTQTVYVCISYVRVCQLYMRKPFTWLCVCVCMQ